MQRYPPNYLHPVHPVGTPKFLQVVPKCAWCVHVLLMKMQMMERGCRTETYKGKAKIGMNKTVTRKGRWARNKSKKHDRITHNLIRYQSLFRATEK